jgi:hypothetical protein
MKPLLMPLTSRLAAALHVGLTSSNDDGSSQLLHLVLLLVLGGILLGSSLEVVAHRYHFTWMPGCALSTLCGVVVGGIMRVTHDPEDIPGELLFSGSALFLIVLPIIVFEMGFSLRKKVSGAVAAPPGSVVRQGAGGWDVADVFSTQSSRRSFPPKASASAEDTGKPAVVGEC